MKKIDLSKPVKFSNPTSGEENLIFEITNYNDVTQRCYIKVLNLPNWGKGLEPQQLVSISDLENV